MTKQLFDGHIHPDARIRTVAVMMGYEREGNAALASHKQRGLVLHGLRATACVRLNSQGATTLEISSMTGMSEPMVARYCRLANKNRLAMQAMERIDNIKTLQTNLLKSKDPTL